MPSSSLPPELAQAMTAEAFEQIRLIDRDCLLVEAVKDAFDHGINTYLLMFGGLRALWAASGSVSSALGLDHEAVQSSAFNCGSTFLCFLAELPFDVPFVLKEKHGLVNQTLGAFAKGKLREIAALPV